MRVRRDCHALEELRGWTFLRLARRPRHCPGANSVALVAREEVMRDLFKALWRDDSGQDTTEYVLLVLLVALAVTAGMWLLTTDINESFSEAGSVLDTGP